MAEKITTKKACLIDDSNGELISVVTLTGAKEQWDQWNTWSNLIYIIPSEEMLDAKEEGIGIPVFNKKTKKWSLKEVDESSLGNDKKEAKEQINKIIADKIRGNKIIFKGKIFSINRRSSWEYLELYVLAFTGIVDFPISIKADDSNEFVQLDTLEDFKQFMKMIYDSTSNIVNIGRILKYGGNFKGIDVKSVSDFTFSEMYQFDADSAVDSLIELSKND